MQISDSINIAASGLKAQSERLKVISQNIANADSISTVPGGMPYQRKTIAFKSVFDREMGANTVKVSKIGVDKGELQRKYDPANPAADADGYIMMPNVNKLTEMTDMKEAKNAYQANLSTIEISKGMIARTLELLR